jgi:hypothetical protein
MGPKSGLDAMITFSEEYKLHRSSLRYFLQSPITSYIQVHTFSPAKINHGITLLNLRPRSPTELYKRFPSFRR